MEEQARTEETLGIAKIEDTVTGNIESVTLEVQAGKPVKAKMVVAEVKSLAPDPVHFVDPQAERLRISGDFPEPRAV
jgi:hypothetical protein